MAVDFSEKRKEIRDYLSPFLMHSEQNSSFSFPLIRSQLTGEGSCDKGKFECWLQIKNQWDEKLFFTAALFLANKK